MEFLIQSLDLCQEEITINNIKLNNFNNINIKYIEIKFKYNFIIYFNFDL